jgi:hypothetical protein
MIRGQFFRCSGGLPLPTERFPLGSFKQLPGRREPAKCERDYRLLEAEDRVERLKAADTRKLVRGPVGWPSFGAAVRWSKRFHLRCNSRRRSRGYWRELGTGNVPFRSSRNGGSDGLFQPAWDSRSGASHPVPPAVRSRSDAGEHFGSCDECSQAPVSSSSIIIIISIFISVPQPSRSRDYNLPLRYAAGSGSFAHRRLAGGGQGGGIPL